ncbi:MAG TPA: IPT/TIG domain-containing protein [Bryobacteraceae bacterium]|nr:IPT/TIG domain-containing protein [Bryobacteraceae bacterium]
MRTKCATLIWLLSAASLAAEQQYSISTIAGGPPPVTSQPASFPAIGFPISVTTDAKGNVYFASADLNSVFRLDANGTVIRIAGNTIAGFSGDGGEATSAELNLAGSVGVASPGGLAVDDAGNLFIADIGNNRIRRVSTSGVITTVAGPGTNGVYGDGGPAVSAELRLPAGIALDNAGNLFVSERGTNRVRKIAASGIITTVAGNGNGGFAGDGGPATSALLAAPAGLTLDANGNLFIVDSYNNRVRKVSPDGIITTFAGSGPPYLASGTAELSLPFGVAVNDSGNLLVLQLRGRVLEFSAGGTLLRTVAGSDQAGFSGDGGPATSAQLMNPFAIALDSAGSLYIADTANYRIRRVSTSGVVTTVAGNGTARYFFDCTSPRFAPPPIDDGPLGIAQLGYPLGVAVDRNSNLFIADALTNRIRKVSPDGIMTTVAGAGVCGGFSGDGGPATSAQLSGPVAIAVDGRGNLFVVGYGNDRIRRISPDGIIATVAGDGTRGFSGDGGPATRAHLSIDCDNTICGGVAVDRAGNLFIADPGFNFETGDAGDDPSVDHRIRRVGPDRIITTVAGNGAHAFSGDGGAAITAAFNGPIGVAVDGEGNIYVADARNGAIRILRPTSSPVLIGAVVDAASQHGDPVSPGKIVVIYGAGLGPSQLIQNQAKNGVIGAELSGTMVSFNGIAAPILYTSATQVGAIVPYAISGSTARVKVSYQGQDSADFAVPVAIAAPSVFTLNQAGWGQAAAITAADGAVNSPANPVKVGEYISLYATGEGQTTPGGADGKAGGSPPVLPRLPVNVTVGGIPATVQYAGSAPGQVAGLMQVNVQIPSGVRPGGYVAIVLQVGGSSSASRVVWIAVSTN